MPLNGPLRLVAMSYLAGGVVAVAGLVTAVLLAPSGEAMRVALDSPIARVTGRVALFAVIVDGPTIAPPSAVVTESLDATVLGPAQSEAEMVEPIATSSSQSGPQPLLELTQVPAEAPHTSEMEFVESPMDARPLPLTEAAAPVASALEAAGATPEPAEATLEPAAQPPGQAEATAEPVSVVSGPSEESPASPVRAVATLPERIVHLPIPTPVSPVSPPTVDLPTPTPLPAVTPAASPTVDLRAPALPLPTPTINSTPDTLPPTAVSLDPIVKPVATQVTSTASTAQAVASPVSQATARAITDVATAVVAPPTPTQRLAPPTPSPIPRASLVAPTSVVPQVNQPGLPVPTVLVPSHQTISIAPTH